jgi:putative transposase
VNHIPTRGHAALRRNRVSLPRRTYFLTLCTDGRRPGLDRGDIPTEIRSEISRIERDGHWRIRAGVIMPDHLHLLLTLGDTLALDRVVARLKSKTRPALVSAGLLWQGNFYEHLLRADDSIERVLRYLNLNPYRTELLPPSRIYPHFWLGEEERRWFTPLPDDGKPFPEWLR